MKFGVHNASWLFGSPVSEIFAEVTKLAQWAEGHGFTWFSVMDHLIQIATSGEPEEPFVEGWTVLSALAAVTKTARLATLVSSVSYRNPAHLAKIAASLDLISGGRVTLGIGAGWHAEEYRQYGWEYPRAAVRIAQLDEAVRLIRAMWADGRATFHGEYFHVENVILEPKPRPLPPIMIAGGGEQLTLRVVAKLADSCNVVGTPEENAHKLAVLRRHCDEVGRNYDEIERTNIVGFLIARDETALKAKHERLGGRPPRFGGLYTVSQATDLIGRYRDVGIQLLIASAVENDRESFELLASDIMPHFA